MTRAERTYPRIIELDIPGITLAGNPLNDPSERRIPVYLPPSYDGKKRFPVIYLLAGFASTGASFMNFSFGRQSVPEMAAALIAEGKMQETIMVMPDCMTRYGGSQYVDSAATGNYETYLVDELVPCIDRTLCTLAARKHRALAGKSSGGFGALRLAMKHPDQFAAIACHSGDMCFELCYKPNFPAAAKILEHYQGSIANFLGAYENALKKPQKEFALLDLIAMAAAYSPDSGKVAPENMRLPFNPYTCEPISEIWNEWLSFDPVEMIEHEEYRDALRSLDLLFLDCGTLDEYNLQFGNRIFSAKAERYAIAHRYEEFMDSHSNTSYRFNVSLPALSAVIAE
ncbi:alpha/beta hydrolase [Pelodictyon phaeoclathratiforme]|jgi:S-formylglutathione hydrolase FrmB|uniref:Putative esterase n=1 Tax=Pelodictyon phaeoclathratiforme (strain DSM 5477 / BU-1) TaxID=324925 RepID=B4SA89_PELPB|nr:alpha/beta hydrolase-fold protein [Pelodictyon phaeoclathratiforme]ACF43785.1 putative esterase [Pelodictyon phaeoclathratiforme BU-1]MBV5289602.1 esterase [Pelodictyon phaeoclathratiforme]